MPVKKRNSKEHDALLEELTSVIAEKTEAAIAARMALRDAVCAFVAVEQARGMPISTVIATVKDILAKVQRGVGKVTDELAQQLIDWCVEFHLSRMPTGPAIIS
ncbi:MAG TPA: hypothetical protein VFD22_00095 [Gemmatimonadaceae bacterium]|jgi:hypothetical protein|nr:hypothetical protein [Gemmatimonadaceae bacterium]